MSSRPDRVENFFLFDQPVAVLDQEATVLSVFGSSWSAASPLDALKVWGSTRTSSNKNAEELWGIIKASGNHQLPLKTNLASTRYSRRVGESPVATEIEASLSPDHSPN